MLKGVCGTEGGRVTREDTRFMEEVIEPAYQNLDSVVRRATAEIKKEKEDVARNSIAKLTVVERNRRFFEDGQLCQRTSRCGTVLSVVARVWWIFRWRT